MNALLNGSIFSAVLAAVVWLALRLIPRRSLNAAARYLIWWTTAAATLALPVALTIATRVPAPTAHLPVDVTPIELHVTTATPAPTATPVQPAHASWQPIPIRASAWIRPVAIAWAVISCLLLLRLLLGFAALRRLSAQAADAPERFRDSAQSWLSRAGAARGKVRLAGSPEISVPVAIGPWRPSILIPAFLFDQLDDADLEHIGLHESVHLARRDDCALLFQRVLEAVFALHPVLRFVTRQIELEREIACDDRVVAATGQPRAYAACLARMVELCGAGAAPLAAPNAAGSRSHFSRRVELLVAPARSNSVRPAAARVLIFAAALSLLAAALAKAPALLAFAPPEPQPEVAIMKPKQVAQTVAMAAALAVPAKPATQPTPAPQPAPQQQAAPRPAQAQEPVDKDVQRFVFLFDADGMTTQQLVRATDSARGFIDKRRQSNEKAVFAFAVAQGAKFPTIKQDFSWDYDALMKTLNQIATIATTGTPASGITRTAVLTSFFRALGVLDGKKALIYFTNSAPLSADADPGQLQEAINAAIKANVAIYNVDVQGITDK